MILVKMLSEDELIVKVMSRLVTSVGPSFVSRHTKNLELIVKITVEELNRNI